jgi:AraC-like DNA-binding protein
LAPGEMDLVSPRPAALGEMIEMIWLTSGQAQLQLAPFTRLQPGTGSRELLIQTGRLFAFSSLKYASVYLVPDSKGYWLRFSSTFLFNEEHPHSVAQLVSMRLWHLAETGVPLSPESLKDITETADYIHVEQDKDCPLAGFVAEQYLKIFLVQAFRTIKGTTYNITTGQRELLVERFLYLVSQNFRTSKQVRDYAERLSVSSNHLNTVIKDITGRTASQYIKDRVIAEARKEALIIGKRVKNISYNLGFSDPAHFSKYFRVVTGVNFTTYRDSVLKGHPIGLTASSD